jgi:hypothetical protein
VYYEFETECYLSSGRSQFGSLISTSSYSTGRDICPSARLGAFCSFHQLSKLYELTSDITTTNLSFSKWAGV